MDFKWILVIFLGYTTTVSAKPHGFEQHLTGSGVHELSIGGHQAEKGQFPFQVSIQWNDVISWKHFCGGSLISHHTVLTAAHCTTLFPLTSIRIVAGEHDFSIDEGTEQIRNADRVIAHPNFSQYQAYLPFDIAIYRVSEPFEFTKYVRAIKLANPEHVYNGTATVSGWGDIVRYQQSIPNILRTEDLPLLEQSECQSVLKKVGGPPTLPDSVLCVGPLDGKMGVCYGDSGGPLVQDGILIGMVSFVYGGCAETDNPSGFTRVSSYTNWILYQDGNIRHNTGTTTTATIE